MRLILTRDKTGERPYRLWWEDARVEISRWGCWFSVDFRKKGSVEAYRAREFQQMFPSVRVGRGEGPVPVNLSMRRSA